MENTIAALSERPPTRQAVALSSWIGGAVIGGLVFALYAWTIADLASEWVTVDASSYGLLIPPLVFYITYLRRGMIYARPIAPDQRGFAVLALACMFFVVGGLAAEFFLSRVSIVFLLAGLVWTFWGYERLKVLAFPLVLLATMVPPPAIIFNAIASPLQLFASSVATSMAQAVGVSVFCEGNVIHLAHTSLGVAEACSGLQSLSALLVGSLLLGYLEDASIVGRVLLFILAAPLAVAVNVVRVTGTAILADYRPELAMGFYHSFSGWLVFLIGFGVLWALGRGVFRLTRKHRHA